MTPVPASSRRGLARARALALLALVAWGAAQAAQIYAGIGAVDGMDVRDMLKADKMSDYYQLAEIEENDEAQNTPTPDQPA